MRIKTIYILLTCIHIFLFPSGLWAAVSIDITNSDVSPTSGWQKVAFPSGGVYDYIEDTWVSGETSLDVVGDVTFPAAYIQFNDDGSEIAVRLRLNACDFDDTGTIPLFKYFAYIGIDANHNGTIDFFLGVFNPTGADGAGRLGIYPAHPDAYNYAAGLTGIDAPVATFAPVDGVNYSFMEAQDGSLFSGHPDYFITFKFNVPDITDAIIGNTKENVTFTPATAFTFIVGTATQEHILTGDVVGVEDNNPAYHPDWTEIFPPPISTDGSVWHIVTFDSNGGEVKANPTYIPVKHGYSLTELPISPARRNGYRFVGWSNNPYDIVPLLHSFILSTPITSNWTIYAIWEFDPTGREPFPEATVHFDGSRGTWAGGMLFQHIESVDGSIPVDLLPSPANVLVPVNPNPPTTPAPSGGNSWVFAGWVKDSKRYGGAAYDNVLIASATGIPDIDFFNPSQLVTELPTVVHNGTEEHTVYALWGQARVTGGGGSLTTRLLFYDNVYGAPGTSIPVGGTMIFTLFTSNNNTIHYAPLPITRQGYTFRGWSRNQNGSGTRYLDPYDPNGRTTFMNQSISPGTPSINFYAVWEADTYAVQFLPNNIDYDLQPLIGSPSGNFGHVLCPATTYGLTYPNYHTYPGEPGLYGYHFLGWNTKPDGTGFGVDPYETDALIKANDLIRFLFFSADYNYVIVDGKAVSQSMQLYALWERDPLVPTITINVKFDAMGGEHINTSPLGPPYYDPSDMLTKEHHFLDLTATNGQLPFVPTPVWTVKFPDLEPYYVLAGWSFDNSPNRTVAIPGIEAWRYDPRFMVPDGTTGNFLDVTLYAVWKKNYNKNIIINNHIIQSFSK